MTQDMPASYVCVTAAALSRGRRHKFACHVQVNLRERQGFIIHPFTVPISTSAAQLSVEHDGYLVEPAFDFKQRAGYISVAKDHRNKYALRGSYAFREVCQCSPTAISSAKEILCISTVRLPRQACELRFSAGRCRRLPSLRWATRTTACSTGTLSSRYVRLPD